MCFNFCEKKDAFKGIVFIQYLTVHEASQGFNGFYLSKIDTRAVKVEFKKKEEKKIITGWDFLDIKCQDIYCKLYDFYLKVNNFNSGLTSVNPGILTFDNSYNKNEKECIRMMVHKMDLQVTSEIMNGEKCLVVSFIPHRNRSKSLAVDKIPSSNKRIDITRHESFEGYRPSIFNI